MTTEELLQTEILMKENTIIELQTKLAQLEQLLQTALSIINSKPKEQP